MSRHELELVQCDFDEWHEARLERLEAELKQFCDDMFGPAAGEMLAYFTLLEDLFCNHLNRRTEQKLFRWNRQFTLVR